MNRKLVRAILLTGLAAGTFDIVLACLQAYSAAKLPPEKVLQFVASGAFGREAFGGGLPMALMGLLFHYIIAIIFTALVFLIYPKFKWMSTHRVLAALLFAFLIWGVMNMIVVPLSRIPSAPLTLEGAVPGMLILFVAVAIPAVYGAYRFYSKPKLQDL